jgi:hypothetical protein
MKNFCELRNFTKMNFLRRCFKKIFDSPVWTKNMFYCKTALILNFSQKNPTKRIHLRSMLLIIKFFPSTMVWSIKNSHWVASDLFHRFDDFLQLLNCFSSFFHWKAFNAVEWSKKILNRLKTILLQLKSIERVFNCHRCRMNSGHEKILLKIFHLLLWFVIVMNRLMGNNRAPW